MPAYNSNFVTPLGSSVNTNTITGATATSSISYIETRELLVAGGEIVMAGEEFDIVEQVTGLVPLVISLDLTTTAPAPSGIGTTQVPYVPGVAVDSGTGATTVDPAVVVTDPVVVESVQMVESYVDAAAGTSIVAHKLVRAWSNSLDPNATFTAYESTDGGATLTQRPANAPPISRFQIGTAMRASDSTYLSLYIDKASMTANPEIYVTKGVIGGALASTTYKWARPDFPVAIACDGTKFVVIAEGNKVYTTLNGVSWTLVGEISPVWPTFPMLLSTQLIGGALYSSVGAFFLQWLPGVAKWVMGLTVDWGQRLVFTADPNAQSGWSATAPMVTHGGGPVAELAGNLYVTSKIDTNSPSVIWKSADGGVTWAESFTGTGILNQFSNGLDGVLDAVNVFKGYLVSYVRAPNPKRLKSTDNGATWSLEATNLPGSTSRTTRLVLANSVVVVTNLGGLGAEYRYSTDGLNFAASTILATDINTGIVVPPPATATDPYWASVKAMSWNQYPTGNLPAPVPVKDVAGSKLNWNGYLTDPQSVVEFPYLGGAVVKGKILNYDSYTSVSQQFISTPGTADSRFLNGQMGPSIGVMVGDFTYEQILATDTEFDAFWLFMYNADLTADGIDIRLGRNMGSDAGAPILPRIRIYKNPALSPRYEEAAVFGLPAALTYFHIAIERQGLIISVYLNGVLKASVTQQLAYSMLAGTRTWARYYGQYRLTVGTARYKGAFTPPSALFPTS